MFASPGLLNASAPPAGWLPETTFEKFAGAKSSLHDIASVTEEIARHQQIGGMLLVALMHHLPRSRF